MGVLSNLLVEFDPPASEPNHALAFSDAELIP